MDSFGALKRRATDIIKALPESLPSLPARKHRQGASLKGTWERISVPPLPRSSHSIDVVAGTAYIFGGELNPRQPVDNDVHAVTLPVSSAPADYYAIKARSENTASGIAREGKAAEGDDVPAPRVGHATAVLGSRIFLFGGRGGPDMQPLEERGRVWIFDTRTHVWSHLDPALPAVPPGTLAGDEGEPTPRYPEARSYHAATATDKPSTSGGSSGHRRKMSSLGDGAPIKPLSRSESWRQWVMGDADEIGTPQHPIVGNVAANATDPDSEGFGTFIIHGGCLANGRASDTWAFDVRSRVWKELPRAPGKARGGTAICISKSRLYRFGGFNGESEEGGQLDMLDLGVDTFDDQRVNDGEVVLTARGPWRSLVQFRDIDYSASGDDETTPEAEAAAAAAAAAGTADANAATPLTQTMQAPGDVWPGPRSVAALEALNVGGGREYLVLALGERQPSNAGHAAAGLFWDDVWVFQVPPKGMSAASVRDAVLQAVGKDSGEGRWVKVNVRPYGDGTDIEDPSAAGPGPRGWIASAAVGDVEENALVIWGGLDATNNRLGDGWILRLD
ncbi:hypothetical protein VTK73DRAFT_4100 [Phialemonium thermophilum]|uniref:Uncharacterized protein n=1 Tax=Phialemonium thermophilum TaxID=223376 RepID=A0ABR3WVE3_9PEZI